jgi:hypothetical protein
VRVGTIVVALSLFSILCSLPMMGQDTGITNRTATPTSGGHDYIQLLDETVDPVNGSLSLRIKLPTPAGRGLTQGAGYNYDSSSLYTFSYPSLNSSGFVAEGVGAVTLPPENVSHSELL